MDQNKKHSKIKRDPILLEKMRIDNFRRLANASKELHPLRAFTPTEFAIVNTEGRRIESKLRYYQNAIFRQKLKAVLAAKISDYMNWDHFAPYQHVEEIVTRKHAAKLLEEYSEGDSKTQVMHPRKLHGIAFAVAEMIMVHFKAIHPKE